VSYTVGARERIDAVSYPGDYHGVWGWHIYGRYYYQTDVVHRTCTEGAFGSDPAWVAKLRIFHPEAGRTDSGHNQILRASLKSMPEWALSI
jgi:hypothetical protein